MSQFLSLRQILKPIPRSLRLLFQLEHLPELLLHVLRDITQILLIDLLFQTEVLVAIIAKHSFER